MERVVKYLNHPPIRTDLGNEGLYSQDLTLLELHAEDAAEMVRLGLSFYDLRTSQYSRMKNMDPIILLSEHQNLQKSSLIVS